MVPSTMFARVLNTQNPYYRPSHFSPKIMDFPRSPTRLLILLLHFTPTDPVLPDMIHNIPDVPEFLLQSSSADTPTHNTSCFLLNCTIAATQGPANPRKEESTAVGFMVAASPATEFLVSPLIGYWITRQVTSILFGYYRMLTL